jgi:hypothetical protein
LPLPEKAEFSIWRRLGILRRRYAFWVLEALLVRWAIVIGALFLLAFGLTAYVSNPLRAAFLLAGIAGILAGPYSLRESLVRLLSRRHFARYLQTGIANSRQDLEIALALERQTFAGDVEAGLAEAHCQRSEQMLTRAPRSLVTAARDLRFDVLAAVFLIVSLGLTLAAPEKFSLARRAWFQWQGTSLAAIAAANETMVIAEFSFLVTPPGYTGLPPETVVGSGELLRAYKGSTVAVTVRLSRGITDARLLMPDAGKVDLKPIDNRFVGEFVVTGEGPFKLSIESGGEWLQDATVREIQLLADEVPIVRLLAPEDALTLRPSDSIQLVWEASDDFGFDKAAVVVTVNGVEKRFPLSIPRDETRASGEQRFNLTQWAARQGGTIQYHVEVYDNDTVSGPKRGTSRVQTIELHSPQKEHRELLDRQDRLFDQVVHILGDQIDLPPAFALAEVAARLSALRLRLREANHEFIALIAGFRTDELADPTSRAELEGLHVRLRRFGSETDTFAKAVSAGTGPQGYPGFRPRGILELEDITIAFADLIQRDRMNDMLYTAEQLKAAREELRTMIADYKSNPSPEKMDAIRAKLAEIRSMMQELARQQMERQETMPDEFLNSDAFKQAQDSNAASQLQDLEKLLEEGDLDAALAQMEAFEQNLGDMLARLGEAGEGVNQPARSGAYQALGKALEEVTELEKGQKKLADELRKLEAQERQAASGNAEELLKELDKRLEGLRSEAKTLEEKSATSRLWNQGYGHLSRRAAAELERARQALRDSDFGSAREAVQRAEGVFRSMENIGRSQEQAQRANPFQAENEMIGELARDSGSAAAKAEKLRRDMEPSGTSSQEGAERLEELEQAQQKLEERLDKVREALKPGSEQAIPVPEETRQALDGGEKAMQGARQKMQSREGAEATMQADEAAEKLGEAREELARMKQQMEQQAAGSGGGGEVPSPQGQRQESEKVEIPDAGREKADRRQEVLKGLREGLPRDYEDLNRKYYDRLVK